MNNIYVDELPNRCDSCVGYGGASGRCKLLHKPVFITPPKDCPLKPLSDRLAEERKKVVQEVKQKIIEYTGFDEEYLSEHIFDVDAGCILKQIDKFERGE